MTDPNPDLLALARATDSPVVVDRVQGRKRYRVAVLADLSERHLQALRPWLHPDERGVTKKAVDRLWAVAGGKGLVKVELEALSAEFDDCLRRRQESGVDDAHPAVSALITVGSAVDASIDGQRRKNAAFFEAWERDVRMPAWDAWGAQFTPPGSTQALIPVGRVLDEFPSYALGLAEVRLEFEHLHRLLDTIDRLEAAEQQPKRETVMAECPAVGPTWQHVYDADRYPMAEAGR